MRIIHTADLHLGSSLGSALPADKIAERRRELVGTFANMADYAESRGAELMLLAGDVFDANLPPRTDKDYFYDVVKRHPNIRFLYLKGNHDCVTSFTEELPNLFTFGPEWTCYRFGNVCVYGIELPEKGKRAAAESLICDPNDTNIVMLHGQTGSTDDDIVIRDYAGKGIDYVALGHVHSYSCGDIDGRGKYVYCGCPEGRGFDETGEKGFVELETGAGVSHRFIPFAQRTIRLVETDVTGARDKQEALAMAIAMTGDIPQKDILRLVFTGETSFDTAGLAADTKERLKHRFYNVSVKDETRSGVDVDAVATEETLAGEFVRLARDADIPEELDRSRIITIGLKALYGDLADYKKER